MSNKMYSGGWKTSDSHKLTSLTAIPLDESKMFRITCTEMVDAQYVDFKIQVDGKQIIAHLNEGGSIFVEGKEIHIEQTTAGVNILATWEVVQEQTIEFERANWTAFPQDGGESLVCAFENVQEFVLSINSASTGCRDGLMSIVIDGTAIENLSGNLLQLLEGSSIIGKGKIVSIRVSGNCDNYNPFRGEVKIRKFK
jgi:hypothetical protein